MIDALSVGAIIILASLLIHRLLTRNTDRHSIDGELIKETSAQKARDRLATDILRDK